MRKLCVSAGFLFALSAAWIPAARGQGVFRIEDNLVEVERPLPFLRETVLEQPFSAELVAQHIFMVGGVRNSRATPNRKLYRDSQGRTRVEILSPKHKPVAEISDPTAGVRYTLDVPRRVAHHVHPPSDEEYRQRYGIRPYVPDPSDTSYREPLGARTILGVVAEGEVHTMTNRGGVMTVERWVAPELKLTMFLKTKSAMVESTQTIVDLKVGEPDPNLFLVPPDFKIVDEKGPFSFSMK